MTLKVTPADHTRKACRYLLITSKTTDILDDHTGITSKTTETPADHTRIACSYRLITSKTTRTLNDHASTQKHADHIKNHKETPTQILADHIKSLKETPADQT